MVPHEPVPQVKGRGAWLRGDVQASVVVFLVALPLCMGVAVASGMPPAAGIVTGIVGGLVVGLLGGCPLQVSGPAAGLTVVVWEIVRERGPDALGPVILLAGLFQVAAGLLRLGRWFRAASPAVIHGMLAGIGVLIAAAQAHVLVDSQPQGAGVANLLALPEALALAVVPAQSGHEEAALLGLASIAALMAWKAWAPRRWRLVPAQLVAVLVGAALAAAFRPPVRFITIPTHLLEALSPVWPARLPAFADAWTLAAAAAVAFIASAETMLCAVAVDRVTHGPRTRLDRELWAQGVGNTLCGWLGALPMTGVIVRSAANVQAGARTRLSAVLHGLWLLALVGLAPGLLGFIPMASLAAILVVTGCQLVDLRAMRSLWSHGKGEVAVYAVTLVVIIVEDLLTGVLTGFGLSLVKLLWEVSHLRVRVRPQDSGRVVVGLEGAATCIRLPKLAAALERLPAGTEVEVCCRQLTYIDLACVEFLEGWRKREQAQGVRCAIDWGGARARLRRHDSDWAA